MKKLTISIINYNANDYLISCLESLRKIKQELDFEVFVVDNASTDGSVEKARQKFPEFNFIFNKENLGFGKAHNLVLKKSDSSYILTLNPDTEVPRGTLSYIYDFMEKNPDVGIASSRVEKADGSIDGASHRGFPTPLASFLYFFFKNDRLYHLTDRDMTKTHEVDSVVGAFMFIKKSVLEKVGYFDEEYFLYGEDIDLCFRVKKAGFKVMYVPEVKIMHVKGVSSGIKKHSQEKSGADKSTKNKSLGYFYSTMKIFYKKHYSKKYPFFINWLVYLGVDIKLFLAKRKNIV
ncbi:glycosyltransferase family 2 protein [Candidatus Roizmanbacteria bacterium]|nr:glycosyltransferase family 2 protein [Candidatus Roizmanbacteria bacterium]